MPGWYSWGGWVGRHWGVTGVAVGVLGALFINYLLMAQLSLSVGQISWARFAQAQLPAMGLSIVLGAATLATAAGTRHLGLPPLPSLAAGSLAAAAAAAVSIRLAPDLVLGEHGMRMGNALRTYLWSRLRPARLRSPA